MAGQPTDKLGINPMLNEIATQLVQKQVIADKLDQSNIPPAQRSAVNVAPVKNQEKLVEEDEELEAIKRKRLEQFGKLKARKMNVEGNQTLDEIEEKEFLPIVTKTEHVVCHFYLDEFQRCQRVNDALSAIAKLHSECRFIKVNSAKAHFFVEKLAVRILPTIIGFENGISKFQLVGLAEFGGDNFLNRQLALRLEKENIICDVNRSPFAYGDTSTRQEDSDDD